MGGGTIYVNSGIGARHGGHQLKFNFRMRMNESSTGDVIGGAIPMITLLVTRLHIEIHCDKIWIKYNFNIFNFEHINSLPCYLPA